MKRISTLTTGVAAMAMALSLNALAAQGAAASEADPQQQPQVKTTVRPHSHMEEKLGIVARRDKSADEKQAAAKRNPATDMSRHFHPRDGGK